MYDSYKDLKSYKWALDVIEGRFLANKYVKLECKRYIDRLENPPEGYFFDLNEIEILHSLLQNINFGTGEGVQGNPFYDHLAGFQFFILDNIWGFVDDEGIRMIQDVTLLMGRKSAKSVLSALLEILILLTADKFSQHALGGLTRNISALIKEDIKKIIKNSPYIKPLFKIQRDSITCLHNEAVLKNLSGEANNEQGLLLSSYVMDEVGNQKTHDLISALKLSQMSTRQRLSINISTGYPYEINVMRDLCDLHKKNLDGLLEDEGMFSLMFELDEEDIKTGEWLDNHKLWIKASPLQMTLEKGIKFLEGEFKKALELPGAMSEFKNRILNMWVNSNIGYSYISIDDIKTCKIDGYNWNDKDVIVGLDLSMSFDNTAVVIMTKDKDDFISQSWCFIPNNKIEEKCKVEKVDYRRFIEKKNCFGCGENKISYGFVENFVFQLEENLGCNIKYIAYDKHNAPSSVDKFKEAGYKCVEIEQSFLTLHKPTKLMKESVADRLFKFVDNDLFVLNVSNAKEVWNPSGSLSMISKRNSQFKIDMLAATLNCFAIIEELNTEKADYSVFIG
ncbi:hypothetical protein HCG68_00140 [Paeniclostridium sordellii]|nr:hypothetical protein [Paeniclostridium sordellii]